MRFVSSLKSKIIISVSAILAVIIGTGTWINIGYQRAQMESALEDNVLIISNTIEKSLENAMLDGKSKEVQHILEAVGTYHNIQELKIFKPERRDPEILEAVAHRPEGRCCYAEMVPGR